MQYPRHVATYSAGCPTKHTDLPSVWQTARRRPALSHFFSQHRSRLNMPDRPVSRLTYMPCFIAKTIDSARLIDQVSHVGFHATIISMAWGRFPCGPCPCSTSPWLRRYAHCRTGCFTCSIVTPYCGMSQNAPVLLLSWRKPLLTDDNLPY